MLVPYSNQADLVPALLGMLLKTGQHHTSTILGLFLHQTCLMQVPYSHRSASVQERFRHRKPPVSPPVPAQVVSYFLFLILFQILYIRIRFLLHHPSQNLRLPLNRRPGSTMSLIRTHTKMLKKGIRSSPP